MPVLVDNTSASSPATVACLPARTLKLDEVPVIVLDHLTESQKRAYRSYVNALKTSRSNSDKSRELGSQGGTHKAFNPLRTGNALFMPPDPLPRLHDGNEAFENVLTPARG
jgi:hypothetical protein